MSHDGRRTQVKPDLYSTDEGDPLARFLECALVENTVSDLIDRAVHLLGGALATAHHGLIVLGFTCAGPGSHELAWGLEPAEVKSLADHLREYVRARLLAPEVPIQFEVISDAGAWLLPVSSQKLRRSSGIVAALRGNGSGSVTLAAFCAAAPFDAADERLFRGVGAGLALALGRMEWHCVGAAERVDPGPVARSRRGEASGVAIGVGAGGPAAPTIRADLSSPLTENSIAGVYIRRGDHVVLCNSRFAELFGYSKDELCGVPIERVMVADACPDQALTATAEHCHSVLGGEVVAGRNRRGQDLWLWTQTWEIEHEGSAAILGNVIDITAQVRSAFALQRSELQLRALSDELLATQENERKRIAGELHDGLGQQLTAIKFAVQSLSSELQARQVPEGTAERLQAIVKRVQDAVEEVRRISMALRPSMLDDLGIAATISWFCREFQAVFRDIEIVRQVQVDEAAISDALKVVIFRILQEAFNNIGKHAQASRAWLRLEQRRSRIRLAVADDGRGFDPREAVGERGGFGLNSMRERARLSDGRLRLVSRRGRGTLILAVWKMRG